MAELIRGIVAAPVLPMTDDFDVDWKGLRDYLRWLTPQGPTAIAMNMDAAEGPALSTEERIRVIEESRDAVSGACPVWSGLIAGSTREAVAQGKALARAGAQGLAVFPPVPTFMGEPLPWQLPYEYHRAIGETTAHLEKFRLNDAAGAPYHFLWDDFADWYLEAIKPRLYGEEPGGATARAVAAHCFDTVLRLLHPVMPFITEYLWQRLPGNDGKPSSPR